MYLLAAARLLMRRWLICLAGLVATVSACFFVSGEVAIDHQATSQMLFILPPAATGEEHPTNPYLNLPEGLTTTAGLVAGNLSTKDSQRQLAAGGATADYTIAQVQGAGPLLAITAIADDPAVALATRDALMDRVDEQLAAMQQEAEVPRDQVMRATRSSVSQDAEPLPGGRYRAVGGTAALALVLVGLLALLVDRMELRRRARRERAAATEPRSRRVKRLRSRRLRSAADEVTTDLPVEARVKTRADAAADPEADPETDAEADAEPEPRTDPEAEAADDEPDQPLEDGTPADATTHDEAPEASGDPHAAASDSPNRRSHTPVRFDSQRPTSRGRNRGRKQRGRPRPAVAIADTTVESVESVDLEDRSPMAG
jgi:hypothetical protein